MMIFADDAAMLDTVAPHAAPSRVRLLVVGALALLAALPLAMVINAIHASAPDNPERAVTRIGALLVLLMGAAPIAVLALRRKNVTPGALGLALVAAAVVVLSGVYLFWASSAMLLRADTLIWSEGPFVADILKFRIGYPLYTAPANLESFFYPPGTQLLTYALATLGGHGTSIPAYRVVQVCYAAVAALLATATTMRVLSMSRPGRAAELSPWWGAVLAPLMFHCATNALTNPFAHALHNDALSVLVSALAYYLLAEYAATRKVAVLVALALVPAVGFYVKQSLVVWAGLVTGYLVVFDQPRSLKRAAIYAVAAFGLSYAGYALARAAWGADFQYWVIEDLKHHPFSVLRSVQHALDAWVYFAAGLVGGLILIGRDWRRVAGLWVVAMLLLAQEAYTSGIAWMLNHMGPGSVLAGIWFAAALAAAWPRGGAERPLTVLPWARAGLAAVLTLFCLSGFGMVRIPVPALPPDIERYVGAIEGEFRGMDAKRVLLDAGSWVYLPDKIVMKDRSAAVGDLGYSGLGDFSGMQQRIRDRYYQRILVRSLNTPDFGYDHYLWPKKSSGTRALLLANYREVRRIKAVEGEEDGTPYLREISVLEPVAPADANGTTTP
jgi:hypothetical protein